MTQAASLLANPTIPIPQKEINATNFLKFRKITLDFKGVKEVGQAFIHELFVVFARENPSIQLEHVGANAFVKRTIERVVAASSQTCP